MATVWPQMCLCEVFFNNDIIMLYRATSNQIRKKHGDGHQTYMEKGVLTPALGMNYLWLLNALSRLSDCNTAFYKRERAFGLQPLFSQERFCSKAVLWKLLLASREWPTFPLGNLLVQSVLHKDIIGVQVLCNLCKAFTKTWFNKTLLLLQSTLNGVHDVGYCQWYSWV